MAVQARLLPSAASKSVWVGRWISALITAFLVLDSFGKLIEIEPVTKGLIHLGYSPHLAIAIGTIGMGCAILYAMPRTAILGAILITGLCGGAATSHLRIGSPLFTHVLFGVYVSVLAWGGLWLRDERLRALIPVRRPQ